MQNGFKSQARGGLDMRTILVAHHDQAFAEQLTTELREGGYRVIECAGPWRRSCVAFVATRAIAR